MLPLAAIAILAACSSSGSPSSIPPAASASAGSAAAPRIEVTLSDALKITPATMNVPAGTPVTFVVKNSGAIAHEFVLGDQAAQQAHEDEMAHGGMTMDEPMAIGVDPGATKELTVTLPTPGSILAACHVAGHWKAGMQATITVQ